MKVRHHECSLFGIFLTCFFHCVLSSNKQKEDASTQTRSYESRMGNYQTYPTDATANLAEFEPVVASPPPDYVPTELIYAPCALVSQQRNGFAKLFTFSPISGIRECMNICERLYHGTKFGVCIPILNCRCLTKGFFQMKNWWSDIKENPMNKPLGIAYWIPT